MPTAGPKQLPQRRRHRLQRSLAERKLAMLTGQLHKGNQAGAKETRGAGTKNRTGMETRQEAASRPKATTTPAAKRATPDRR